MGTTLHNLLNHTRTFLIVARLPMTRVVFADESKL